MVAVEGVALPGDVEEALQLRELQLPDLIPVGEPAARFAMFFCLPLRRSAGSGGGTV
jgi:hypothetical protein